MFNNLGNLADLMRNAGKIRETMEKATESLGQGPGGYGVLFSVMGVGAVAGGLVIAWLASIRLVIWAASPCSRMSSRMPSTGLFFSHHHGSYATYWRGRLCGGRRVGST